MTTIHPLQSISIKPYADQQIQSFHIEELFEDAQDLYETATENKIPKSSLIELAAHLVNDFIQIDPEIKKSYHPIIYYNETGIHTAVILDLDIQYLKKTDPQMQLFSPYDILKLIHQ